KFSQLEELVVSTVEQKQQWIFQQTLRNFPKRMLLLFAREQNLFSISDSHLNTQKQKGYQLSVMKQTSFLHFSRVQVNSRLTSVRMMFKQLPIHYRQNGI